MNYVLVAASLIDNKNVVLVIEKKRPAWQAGKLNLIGGKIEAGETPKQAALREFKEETGVELYPQNLYHIGDITGHDYNVAVYSGFPVSGKVTQMTDEPIEWISWPRLKEDKRTIPNLKIIVPFWQANLSGWIIAYDEYKEPRVYVP